MAATALVVSILSVLLTLVVTLARWPRVTVFLEPWTDRRFGREEQLIRLIATNHGNEPISVVKLTLGTSRPNGDEVEYDYDFDKKYQPDCLPEGGGMPAEIPGRGVKVWTYEDDQLYRFQQGDLIVGRLQYFKTFRLVPMFMRGTKTSAYKVSRSRQRVVRI